MKTECGWGRKQNDETVFQKTEAACTERTRNQPGYRSSVVNLHQTVAPGFSRLRNETQPGDTQEGRRDEMRALG